MRARAKDARLRTQRATCTPRDPSRVNVGRSDNWQNNRHTTINIELKKFQTNLFSLCENMNNK